MAFFGSRDEDVTELRKTISSVAEFINKHRPLVDVHLVDFIVDDHWRHGIPETIGNECLQLSMKEWFELLKSESSSPERGTFKSHSLLEYDFNSATLKEFVKTANQLILSNLNICLDVQDILELHGAKIKDQLEFDNIMKIKKMHEVVKIADVVVSLAEKFNIKQIVDVGSGKGYLGSFIAFRFRMDVFGIDAKQSNSVGAVKWNQRIKKMWKTHERRASERKLGITPSKRGKRGKSHKNCDDNSAECIKPVAESKSVIENTKEGKTEFSPQSVSEETNETRDLPEVLSISDSAGCYIPITRHIKKNNDINEILQPHIPTSDSFLLVGLHACGSLSANMIDMFLTNDKIKVLCIVGCCYHLLDEKFIANPFWKKGAASSEELGFPLSEELTKNCFALGRNARMLASQSLDRFINTSSKAHLHLFYRALLQVVLQDKLACISEEMHVGRLEKCDSFTDYVRQAVERLKLTALQITNEELISYLKKYEDYRQKIEAFFHLRSLLAPIIEGLLLLDRLCYLKEQESVGHAYLTRLFDPVTSPRCYAIIAVKKTNDLPEI